MRATKTEILSYVEELTQRLNFQDMADFTSNSISESLAISRSLASQYLNQLHREGILIKIASRPVYFIDRKTLEEKFHVSLAADDYLGIDDLIETIQEESVIKRNYETLVGYDTFLKQPINQIKAALKFPGIGLPVIIHGNAGVGKTRLVREMFSYGMDNHLFSGDAKLCEIKVVKDTDIIHLLVGSKDTKGVLENARNGIVFIRNCQNLSLENQQQLSRIVEKGFYIHPKNHVKMDIKCHIFLSVDGNYKTLIDGDLAQCFPAICELPDFHLLDYEEKVAFVIQILQDKSLRLKKKIYLSKNALEILISQKYYRNIDDLNNIMMDICALINTRSEDETLLIDATELPLNYIRPIDVNNNILLSQDDGQLIDVSNYTPYHKYNRILDILSDVLDHFIHERSNDDYLILPNKRLFSDLVDCFSICLKTDSITEIETLSMNVQSVITGLIKSYNYAMPYVSYNMISYFLINGKDKPDIFVEWESKNKIKIETLIQFYQANYPSIHLLIEKIMKLLEITLDFHGDDMLRCVIMLNLNMYNSFDKTSPYLCFIAAHGDSTATSMSNAVNTLIGTSIFEGLDLSLNFSAVDLVEKMKSIILQYMIKTDVLVLVDMGSLEGIDKSLKDIPNKNIGLINNVSTKLALDVGYMVKDGYPIDKILNIAVEHSQSSYSLIKNSYKRNLVIFVSDNGISMANRMKNLFVSSLPKNIQLDIESFTVENILNEEFMNNINQDYNLLFISGMTNRITSDKYISLENILSTDEIDDLVSGLSQYLTNVETQMLLDNLLHNFSLENIIASLSILDGRILFKFVENAVVNLQQELNVRLSRNNLVGLYIHLCCMVERLVTKEPIKNKENLDEFIKKHIDFINIAKKCMEKTCSHYGIEIEVAEIAYLFDFVRADVGE